MTEQGPAPFAPPPHGGPTVHPTLARQLRRLDLTAENVPDIGSWSGFLARVNATYSESDSNRALLERSLSISSSEMRSLYTDLRTSTDRELRAERDRLQVVFNSVPAGLVVIDPYGVITDVNEHSRHVLGAPLELVGRFLSDVVSCVAKGDLARKPQLPGSTVEAAISGGGWRGADLMVAGPLGRTVPCDVTLVPFGADGQIDGAVVVFVDASEREAARARLSWHQTHDGLTQLPNRVLLIERLEQSLVAARSTGEWPGILCIGVDHFKKVNDTLGHQAGDRLLVMAADRIASTLRAGDTVARMGGDEFLVLCEGVDTMTHLRRAAERLEAALTQPFTVGTTEVRITVSTGIAVADGSTPSADALLRQADAATSHAKAAGRARISEPTAAAPAPIPAEHVAIAEALRSAIELDEFSVVYQPIAQVADGRLVGFEALLRWNSATLGPVPPGLFIPIAEQIGLMSSIGSWVLDVAARDAASWQSARGTDLAVHVNISECQLVDPRLPQEVAGLHQRHGLLAGTLTLEITEEMLVADTAASIQRIAALKSAGAGLALDDFGTGHVSLADLRHFPLRTFKVDREFVSGMPTSEPDRRIVQAIIDLAHGLGHVVVAEGVEKDSELALLQEMGCDMAQGWLFGHPLSPAEALLVAASATSRSL